MKGMVLPGTMFEEMGFNYIGPIDGHDLDGAREHAAQPARRCRARSSCTSSRARARATRRPRPTRSSGTARAPSTRRAARSSRKRATGPAYSQVFGQWLCDMAERDPRIVGITPAMREGSGLVEFSKRFPDRYFDVAIAEQHAVTLAAGLACEGCAPGRRDLLDLPAARLRPADPRRRAAEPAGRRSRSTAPGSWAATARRTRALRPELPALHPEPGGDGAGRRERVPADALHGGHARRPGGRALSARPGPGRARSSRR